MSQASLFSGNLMPERRVWKVSEITTRIRDLLEGNFNDIWIEGEISNFRPSQNGHLYFTLKDLRAQIRCVCFRDNARLLKFRPEDGLRVNVRGSISVYDQRGEYQVYVTHLEPMGLGALQLAFEQLKKKLAVEGLFDESRKKQLPALPRCIGVVSSPTGAAVRDILRVLKRRFPNVHVRLFPVKVQGDGAALEIVQAVRYFNRTQFAEVLIVARGGGSLEDLWAFNEEIVARAIAASEIPVITGIGHETDFTIADFAADFRAPTPSAAAEIVVRTRKEFEDRIHSHARHLAQQMLYRLSQWRHRVRDLQTHHGFREMEVLIRNRRQHVDELAGSLALGMRLKLGTAGQRLARASTQIASFDLRSRAATLRRRIELQHRALAAALAGLVAQCHRRFNEAHLRLARFDLRSRVARLRHAFDQQAVALRARIDQTLIARRRRVESISLQLDERSPLKLLERGYAIAYDASGRVLRSVEQVETGDEFTLRLARGSLDATVKRKRNPASQR